MIEVLKEITRIGFRKENQTNVVPGGITDYWVFERIKTIGVPGRITDDWCFERNNKRFVFRKENQRNRVPGEITDDWVFERYLNDWSSGRNNI